MLFTMKEVAEIHKTFLNVTASSSLSEEDIEHLVNVRSVDLIDVLAAKLGMIPEALDSVMGYVVAGVKDEEVNVDQMVITIGVHFKSEMGTYRDAAGNINTFSAPKGQYSVIKVANSVKAAREAALHPSNKVDVIELKPLHFDTNLNAWGFGIPFEKKVS